MNNQSQQRAAQRLKRRRKARTKRHLMIVAPREVFAAAALENGRGRSQGGCTVAAWRANHPIEVTS